MTNPSCHGGRRDATTPENHSRLFSSTLKAETRFLSVPRLFLLLSEFLGTDDEGTFINLSDGGHFENLGLYELARRRCDLILISDASQDDGTGLSGLGMAIERCRTDFGYEVELDTSSFVQKIKANKLKHAYLIGTIKYSLDSMGVIIYFKAAKLCEMPPDLVSYSASNKTFPHQSTSNQWYSEARFESYRKLGFLIAADLFTKTKQSGKSLLAYGQGLLGTEKQ